MKLLTKTLFKSALTNLTVGLLMVVPCMAQTSASYDWQNVAIGGGGFVSSVIADPNDPNIFYTRTDVGGAYRWEESSQSWISLMDWVDASERGLLGVEAIAVDPNQQGTVYLMTGTNYWNQADDGIGRSAFLRSNDYGETWDKIYVWDDNTKNFNVHGNGMGRGNGEALAIDPANSNTIFYGTRNKGLWKSTNNGDTWSKVNSFPVDTTWNGAGISFVKFDPSTTGASETSRIYVGVLRDSDNVFVSEDGGDTWSLVPNRPIPEYAPRLMPQRIAVRPDGSKIYITFGDGAGPHTMQWDEGWGMINDWFNRGAVYEYDVATQSWTDISPQNLIDPEGEDYTDPSTYLGCYSGISINPNNPDHMVVSSIASYRGPQFWLIDGEWSDQWGDNIFVTEDGGETWVPSFEFYWLEGGQTPPAEQMNENGVPWIVGNTIHWIGGVMIDPNNPQRVFVTSGNGVFMTEDIFNYEWSYENEWGDPDTSYTQYTEWKFAGHGIEETVPEDIVSIPGGPLVSVIADYDGFVHQDVTQYPALGRHTTIVDGSEFALGTTRGLAFAPQTGKLAKVADAREVSTEYNDIPIGPVQYSTDNGETWTVETYTSNPPTDLSGGKIAMSADGAATLWMPSSGTTMYRHSGSSWSEVSGISFNGRPAADWVDPSLFYVYNNDDGYMYVSNDAGVSFSQAGFVGSSSFRTARTVPNREGHIWVPVASEDGTSGGLMRSSDGGTTFTDVPGVGYCEAVGFGKAADGAEYPAVYVFAEIDGALGVWRSVDEGSSWVRVNDDEHEYGGLANGEFVRGDMNVFGRVYMSTAGRGIVYGDPAGETVPVTGVSVSPTSGEITVGANLELTADVSPSNATNQSVSWSTDNASVATVNNFGVVTGQAAGTAAITVSTSDGGYTATANITVNDDQVPVTGIEVSPISVTLDEGQTATLSASISPADATNQDVSWSSDNTTVATVNASGVVTGVSEGTATVTVTTDDGGHTATSAITVTTETGGITGTILREYWTGISGTQISSLTSDNNYPDNPSGSEEITSLEGPVDWGDNYGTRIRGYVHPNVSGDYTFWVAGDDNTDLYLSSGESPSNTSRIAYVEGWTNSREWNKYASQQSATVSLTAGQKYYIEVLHKEGSGGDNVAVAWEGPGISQAVIDGDYLSPYEEETGGNNDPDAAISASTTSGIAPLTVDFDASGSSDPDGDNLTYSWTFGDGATATGISPSHTYDATGTFTATVTVDDGNGGSDNASVNITVSDDTPDQFTLSTSTTGSGSIDLDPLASGGTYDEGTIVTVTANADAGWEFDSWSGDLNGTTNPESITMNADHSVTANFTESGGGQPCESPVTISIPFSFDGEGDFCWVTSDDIANINSWNLNSLVINGVDYTNSWANSFPEKIDGNYYIEYSASVSWAHFEAAGLSNITIDNSGNNNISLYPVPFSKTLTLEMDRPEAVQSITILDNVGRTIQVIKKSAVESVMEIGGELEQGMYIIRVDHTNDVQTFSITKN